MSAKKESQLRPQKGEPPTKREIKKIVVRGLCDAIVVPSISDWSSAVLLVEKPGGSAALRIYQRPLDVLLEASNHALRERQFSVFVEEAEPAWRKYLPFVSPGGLPDERECHLESWRRLPLNSEWPIAGLKWCCAIAYLDVILILSNTFGKHLGALFVWCC